jgi:hypothetical protein
MGRTMSNRLGRPRKPATITLADVPSRTGLSPEERVRIPKLRAEPEAQTAKAADLIGPTFEHSPDR